MQLFLAGGEAWLDLLLDNGVRNILLSFFYFRTMLQGGANPKARRMLARMAHAKTKGYRFFLDSGAFTYHSVCKKNAAKLPKPSMYFQEYMDFIKQYGEAFNVIAELDIDNFVRVDGSGMPVNPDDTTGRYITVEEVDNWTNTLLDLPGVGERIMPVYHPHRGAKWMSDWLADTRSPLVGVSSTTLAGSGGLIAQSHQWGKFVHGFAQTRIKTDLKYTKFDSVDSTTWLRADKYGGTNLFVNGKFIVLDHLHKADRRQYIQHYERLGLDWSLIAKDDLHTLRRANIFAWRDLASDFEVRAKLSNIGYPYLYAQWEKTGQLPEVHPLMMVRGP